MISNPLRRLGSIRLSSFRPVIEWPTAAGSMIGGRVTLRTLIVIRWVAVLGQLITVLVVNFGLGFDLPLGAALAAIGASVLLNVIASTQQGGLQRLTDSDAALYLAYDTLQLALLLYLTGGLVNPFSALLLSPTTVGAAILSQRSVVLLTGLNLMCLTVLARWSLPLPWPESLATSSALFAFGLWLSLTVSATFIAAYVFRVAEEARRFANALAASQVNGRDMASQDLILTEEALNLSGQVLVVRLFG